MNLINKQYKVVTYLGMTLAVPMDASWIAVDPDGCCYGHCSKPHIAPYVLFSQLLLWRSSGTSYWVGDLQDTPPSFDWKQSLVCVGDKQ